MGDLVLREEEAGLVQQGLLTQGLTVAALHEHFSREDPRIAFLNHGGIGPVADLAQGLRAALDRTGTPGTGNS